VSSDAGVGQGRPGNQQGGAWEAVCPDRRLTGRSPLSTSEFIRGGIHHVGSTAVPGLDAKPVIDILAGIGDLATARP
jgi:GrpB protein